MCNVISLRVMQCNIQIHNVCVMYDIYIIYLKGIRSGSSEALRLDANIQEAAHVPHRHTCLFFMYIFFFRQYTRSSTRCTQAKYIYTHIHAELFKVHALGSGNRHIHTVQGLGFRV